jgi:hypothetical protein
MSNLLTILALICALVGCKPNQLRNLDESQILASSDSYFMKLKSPVRLYNWTSVNRQDLSKLSLDTTFNRLSSSASNTAVFQPPKGPGDTDRGAMGALMYLAFSPTEAFQFAIEDAIGPSDSQRFPVLQSFEVPAGATYALVATEAFLNRIRALSSKFPNCMPIPFERLEPVKISGRLGLKVIQGIFRSCPDFRKALLTDESGKQATFAVFPEVSTFAFEIGTYTDVFPQSRVDNTFSTQSKLRWAVLTSSDAINKESLVLYHPTGKSGGNEIRGAKAQSVSNLGVLRCAFNEGSTIRALPDARVMKTFLEISDKMAKTAYVLSVPESDLSAAWEEYRSQSEFKEFSDDFFNATFSESSFWSEARSSSDRCLSLYELAHGDSNEKVKASVFLSRISARESYEKALLGCPGLRPSIALAVSDAQKLLPFHPNALPEILEKAKQCPEIYEDFVVRMAPQIRGAYESCRKRRSGGTNPIKSLSLTGCDEPSKAQLKEFSFLSKHKPASDFLGTGELGDDVNFLLD